jgi:serine/threonine protein phosphatase 1
VDGDLDVSKQRDAVIFWERFDGMKPHKSGKKVVCGHTPDLDGLVRDVGFAVCIDTAAAFGGWLTCLDVESGRIWQANEKGKCRVQNA